MIHQQIVLIASIRTHSETKLEPANPPRVFGCISTLRYHYFL